MYNPNSILQRVARACLEERRARYRYGASLLTEGANRAREKRRAAERELFELERQVRRGVKGLPNARRSRYHLAGWKVLGARLEVGRWYAVTDMYELMPEFRPKDVRVWLYGRGRLADRGYVEKALNPDYAGRKRQGPIVCVWLWRLTEAGERAAAEWRGALREAGEWGKVG